MIMKNDRIQGILFDANELISFKPQLKKGITVMDFFNSGKKISGTTLVKTGMVSGSTLKPTKIKLV